MDKESLMKILVDSDQRSYWIKPVGIPGDEPDIHAVFSQPNLTVEFARCPDGIEIGDILIVYRIGVSKIVYVGEVLTSPREVTDQEIKQHPWMERWCWTIELCNLTQEYGKAWAKNDLKPFQLAEIYTDLTPEDPQSLGSILFGNDKLRISNEFGAYILRKIIRLPG